MSTTIQREVELPAAPGGLAHELRATAMVWRREMIRFRRDRTRVFAMLLQPLLFLFVMGTGLSSVVSVSSEVDFRTFLFPGVLAMSVLFSAAFAGISLVWDREFGFLREMLVAPVSKTSIILGKCLGGATTATLQTTILLALAGLVGVPYDLGLLLSLLGLLFLGALMLTALGVLLSARIKQIQSAMPASQLIITPMMFLSGALFPLANLPGWLSVLTKVNPLTYVVQPMRSVVFDHLDVPASARAALDPAITWAGWEVPVVLQVLIAVTCTVGLIAAGIAIFNRTD
ncbi:ABC transporter permease [Prauserella flavalba]|uniref:Transport permease protein n=1 Tax=Prauserella flavalba TaxID=1477506 RepID=A0A318LZJ8_9PSEU|nr:ABC transporter permease [Prauserella flavalba]PXY38208.1 ABC transporter [Prauserella flavalba]